MKQIARALFIVVAMAGMPPGAALGQVLAGEGRPMTLPLDATPLIVTTAGGERRFWIEVADDEEERAAGLMFRQDMPDDRGMLFVFQHTQHLSFWMKNTPMPLDLLYLDEQGVVGAILAGRPFSEDSLSPPFPARFVLELKAGTAARNGIAVGDRMRHPEIARASGGRKTE